MNINVQKFRKPCACGRTHEIVVDDMIIEKGAIQRLPHIMKTYYSEYSGRKARGGASSRYHHHPAEP